MLLVVQILHAIIALILIGVVLFQSGKKAGMSGTIAGGSETFFGKSKARTIDAMLERATSWVAVLFLITSIVLFFLTRS